MNRAFVAIGGNITPSGYDNLEAVMADAVAALSEEALLIKAQSRWYETAPVPISDQHWFLNAVMEIETSLSAAELLLRLHQLEADFGRVRKVRNEARILDLDLIDYNGSVFDQPDLQLPHPRMHLRAFVLYPIADIMPDWRHPVLNKSVMQLIEEMPEGQDIRAKT